MKKKMSNLWRKRILTDIVWHHSSGVPIKNVAKLKYNLTFYTVYSFNLVPCDFYLILNLQKFLDVFDFFFEDLEELNICNDILVVLEHRWIYIDRWSEIWENYIK